MFSTVLVARMNMLYSNGEREVLTDARPRLAPEVGETACRPVMSEDRFGVRTAQCWEAWGRRTVRFEMTRGASHRTIATNWWNEHLA